MHCESTFATRRRVSSTRHEAHKRYWETASRNPEPWVVANWKHRVAQNKAARHDDDLLAAAYACSIPQGFAGGQLGGSASSSLGSGAYCAAQRCVGGCCYVFGMLMKSILCHTVCHPCPALNRSTPSRRATTSAWLTHCTTTMLCTPPNAACTMLVKHYPGVTACAGFAARVIAAVGARSRGAHHHQSLTKILASLVQTICC